MSKHITFNSVINEDSVLDLIDILEVLKEDGNEEDIVLHWTSEGGMASYMNVLVQYINEYPNDLKVITHDLVASCGLLFLLKINREIIVGSPTVGMAHLSDISVRSIEIRDKNSWSTALIEEGEIINAEYLSLYEKMGLNKEQLDIIKEGRDIYITSDKLIKHLDYFKTNEYVEMLRSEQECIYEELESITEEINAIEKEISDKFKNIEIIYAKGDKNDK